MARGLDGIEVVMLASSTPAFISTITRLVLRRRRLWADDGWAFFSMLALIVQFVAVFMHPRTSREGVARYYLLATAFSAIIWSARLSLLFSLIRVDPYVKRRSYLYGIAVIYIIFCILLIGQLLWTCQAELHWKMTAVPQCHLGLPVALFQLITDVLADGCLLVVPMFQFRIIIDRSLRHRLLAIFSTCIITTVVSLVHTFYLLTSRGIKVEILGIVENCVSLIVCNIPVIATALLRLQEETSRQMPTALLSTIMFHSEDEEQGTPSDGSPAIG